MSKVLLLGDCHGKFRELARILTQEEPFDLCLMTGDLGGIDSELVNNYSDRVKSIIGNHDSVEMFPRIDISSEICGLHICGLSGIIKSRTFIKDLPNNISFREVLYLSHLKDVDILVTHQLPKGLMDGYGEPVLTELLNYLVPRVAISGHVHKYKLKFYLNTFVISLPLINKGYAVAYFDGKELKNLEIILKKGKKVIRV